MITLEYNFFVFKGHSQSVPFPQISITKKKIALGGFEPPSLAPKASMIGLLTDLTATPQGCKRIR